MNESFNSETPRQAAAAVQWFCDFMGWEFFVREDRLILAKDIQRGNEKALEIAAAQYGQIFKYAMYTSPSEPQGNAVGSRQQEALTNGRVIMAVENVDPLFSEAMEELQ